MSLNSNIIWLSTRWRSPCWRFYLFRINAFIYLHTECSEHRWPTYCSRALTSKPLRVLLSIFVWALILLKLLFNKRFTAIWSCISITVCIFWLHQQQFECLVFWVTAMPEDPSAVFLLREGVYMWNMALSVGNSIL